MLPTGSGKTIVFSSVSRDFLYRFKGNRALILVNNRKLANQTKAAFHMVWPEVAVGIVQAKLNEADRQIVVASVPTLSRLNRLMQFGREDFDLVIVDEAHHAQAQTWRQILRYFQPKLLLGVTATPTSDSVKVFGGNIVYKKTLLELIKAGYLPPIIGIRIGTHVDLSGVTIRDGDYDEKELASILNTENRNELLVATWQKYAKNRHTIVFSVTVEHSIELARVYQAAGIDARYIHSKMGEAEKEKILDDFTHRRFPVLLNYGMVAEGYDIPSVNCVMMARPTLSWVLYSQMMGRGARDYPGKRDLLVIDAADNTATHSLMDLAKALGLEDKVRWGTEDRKAIKLNGPEGEKPEKPAKPEPAEAPQMVYVGTEVWTETVDLFAKAEEASAGSRLRWLVQGDEITLSLGRNGTMILRSAGAELYIAVLEKDGEIERLLTDEPMELTWAQGMAEGYIRKEIPEALALAMKSARWTKNEASPRQAEVLGWYGVDAKALKLNSGQASEIISLCEFYRKKGDNHETAGQKALARHQLGTKRDA